MLKYPVLKSNRIFLKYVISLEYSGFSRANLYKRQKKRDLSKHEKGNKYSLKQNIFLVEH